VQANQETPILQCHGDSDPLVSPSFGAMTSQLISTFNSNIKFKTYKDMGHSSSDEVTFTFLPSFKFNYRDTLTIMSNDIDKYYYSIITNYCYFLALHCLKLTAYVRNMLFRYIAIMHVKLIISASLRRLQY